MTKIHEIINWKGAVQQITPRRLADGLGVNVANLWRGYADLRGLPGALEVVGSIGTESMTTAWRMGRDAPSDTQHWLLWPGDVDVVRAFNASDPDEEIHYTGDGVPKTTDMVLALPSTPEPAAWRTLGIPKPTGAMAATLNTAGAGDDEVRVYVDTYLNDQGRESAPGTSVSITVAGGSSVDLGTFSAVPSGDHGITHRQIYVSTDGGPFQLVASITTATSSVTDAGTVRGEIMQSGGDPSKPAWEAPPDDLAGLIHLWNGMLGGFTGKEYRLSEPYKAWAWPVEYGDTLPDTIVGTGVFGQTWVLLTTANPVVVRGAGPLYMTWESVEFHHACVSKRSVISLGHGVAWASPRGLCYLGQGGARMLTEGIFSQAQWQALVPSTMHCAQWEDMLLCFFDDDEASGYTGFMIDPAKPGDGVIFLDECACGTYRDPISDRLYLLCCGIETATPEPAAYAPLTVDTYPPYRRVLIVDLEDTTLYDELPLAPSVLTAGFTDTDGNTGTVDMWMTRSSGTTSTCFIGDSEDLSSTYVGMGQMLSCSGNGTTTFFNYMRVPLDTTDISTTATPYHKEYAHSYFTRWWHDNTMAVLKDGVPDGTEQQLVPAGTSWTGGPWLKSEADEANMGSATVADIVRWGKGVGLATNEWAIDEMMVQICTRTALTNTGTLSLGAGVGSITGAVGFDQDHDGTGDTALYDVTMTLKQGGSTLGTVETDKYGVYEFTGLSAGSYTVEMTRLPGELGTASASASVSVAGVAEVADFIQQHPLISIWGTKQFDRSPRRWNSYLAGGAEVTAKGNIRLNCFRYNGSTRQITPGICVVESPFLKPTPVSSGTMDKLTVHGYWQPYVLPASSGGGAADYILSYSQTGTNSTSGPMTFAVFISASGYYGCKVRDSGNADLTVTGTVLAVAWTRVHFAVVVDGQSVKLYINGTLAGSGTLTGATILNDTTASELVLGNCCRLLGTTAVNTDGAPGFLGGVEVIPRVALWSANFTAPAAPNLAEVAP